MQKQEKQNPGTEAGRTRRDVIRAAAYVAPVVLTLVAAPAFAKGGTGDKGKDGEGNSDNDWD